MKKILAHPWRMRNFTVAMMVLLLTSGCADAHIKASGECEWTPDAEDMYEWKLLLVEGDGACEGRLYSANYWGSETVVPGWCKTIDVRGCYAEAACSAGEAYGGSTPYVARITMDSDTGGTAEVTSEGCVGEYELVVRRTSDFEDD
jgi:hypothetical protein